MNDNGVTRRDTLILAASAAGATLLPGWSHAAASPARTGLTLFSQHINWTSIEEGIEVAASAGFSGIAWAVRATAHVTPEQVARDLPRAVELTHRAGLGTPLIATELTDASSPNAQAIVETAAGLGIRSYRVQSARYDYKRDLTPQVDALRSRVASLAKLNERYGATALFHTHGGHVSGSGWDTWLLLRDFDPDRVAINFDTGWGVAATGTAWKEFVRFARGHIRALSLKDFRWRQEQTGARRWVTETCPAGEGMVDYQEVLGYFQSTGFHGSAELQFEYPLAAPGLAAPIDIIERDVGKWTLEIPKATYIALLKRDADFYTARLRETGLAPAADIVRT